MTEDRERGAVSSPGGDAGLACRLCWVEVFRARFKGHLFSANGDFLHTCEHEAPAQAAPLCSFDCEPCPSDSWPEPAVLEDGRASRQDLNLQLLPYLF